MLVLVFTLQKSAAIIFFGIATILSYADGICTVPTSSGISFLAVVGYVHAACEPNIKQNSHFKTELHQ